jgi:hypothetical protein
MVVEVLHYVGHVPFQVFLHPLDFLVQGLDLLLQQGIIIWRVIDNLLVLALIRLTVIGLLLLLFILIGITCLIIFRV